MYFPDLKIFNWYFNEFARRREKNSNL